MPWLSELCQIGNQRKAEQPALLRYGGQAWPIPCKQVCRGCQSLLADPQGACPAFGHGVIFAAKAAPLRTRDRINGTCQHQKWAGQTNPFRALYSRRKWAKVGQYLLNWMWQFLGKHLNVFPRNSSVWFILTSVYARRREIIKSWIHAHCYLLTCTPKSVAFRAQGQI